jgi:non-ribosomal peptide synthetase component F
VQTYNSSSRTLLPKARAIASEQLPLGTRERAQDSCILTEREEERRKILIEWNQTACDYPREKCLHELVAAQAQLVPERVAVIWKDQQLSYREFNSRANQLAHYLSERGVGPSAKVAICLNPSLDFAVAVLAVLKSGAACVPLDPKYRTTRQLAANCFFSRRNRMPSTLGRRTIRRPA